MASDPGSNPLANIGFRVKCQGLPDPIMFAKIMTHIADHLRLDLRPLGCSVDTMEIQWLDSGEIDRYHYDP